MRRLLDELGKLRGGDLGGLAVAPGNIPNAVFLSATEPAKRSAGAAIKDKSKNITDALKHEMYRQRQYKDGSYVDLPEPRIKPNPVTPTDRLEAAVDVLTGRKNYASNASFKYDDGGLGDQLTYNPNADEAFLYHELGHIANRQSGLGKLVRDIRDNIADDPNLGHALLAAIALAPGTATALIPGDDDAAAATMLATAAAAPVLADELMATNTGLRMMETAGNRASLGQRGKLAGSFLSYLAPVIGTGLISGATGNMFD